MKADDFLAKVRERGEFADQEEARLVTATVLGVLAERLAGDEPGNLAAQLPAGIDELVTDELVTAQEHSSRESFGVEEFLRRVAAALNGSPESAKWDASAVLCTTAEAVTGGQLNQVLTQLQPGYAELFGVPQLA